MRMRIFHRGLILVGVPLLLELVLICSLSFLHYQSVQQRTLETRYRRYSSEVANLMSYISSAPLMLAMSVQFQSDKLAREYKRQVIETRNSVTRLKTIMADIPEIPSREYPILDTGVNAILKVAEAMSIHRMEIGMGGVSSFDNAAGFQATLQHARKAIAIHLNEMFKFSDQMTLNAQKSLDQTNQYQFIILNLIFVLNLLMGAWLAWFYKRGIVDRVKTIARNTAALAKGQPLEPRIDGNDEIAEFDHSFHSMLEQLAMASQNEHELFETASDVICVLDAGKNFLKVNPASKKDWGIEPQDLVGRNLADVVDAADLKLIENNIEESAIANSSVSFETGVKSGDGTSRVGLWSAYWSKDEQKLFCIVHDVTERKQVEQAKRHFLTLISSDLKLPLNRIRNALSELPALNAGQLTALGSDRLEMAAKNVDRLLGLVNDLLQVAEMESGNLELHPLSSNLQELFTRSVADVETLANSKQISFELSVAPELAVYADPDRIMQVLINLLSNAIKFSPENSTIQMTAEVDCDFVVCRVIDQGRGIPASHRESIFEKFSQVEKHDGKRKAGTGLGLPICKQIVEEHGGKIGVESTEGKGSSFWISLPADSKVYSEKQRSPGAGHDVNNLRMAPASTTCSTSAPENMPEQKAPFGTVIPLSSKGVLLIGIPVIFELLLVAFLSNSLLKMEHDRAQELLMRQIAVTASKVSKAVLYTSSAGTDDPSTIERHQLQLCYQEWANAQRELEKLCDSDSYAKAEFERLQVQTRKMKRYRDQLVRRKNDSLAMGPAASLTEKLKYLPILVSITKHLRSIITHAEHEEFLSPEKQMSILHIQLASLSVGVLFSVAFAFGLAMFFSFGFSRRILIMANNTQRLANDEPLNPIMGGKDELAQLDLAFHKTAQALAEARKKERAVFDNSKDVFFILSPSGGFLNVNSAVETSWGYTRKEMAQASLESIIIPEDLAGARQALLGDIDINDGLKHECRIRRKSGDICYVLWSASRKSDSANTYCVVHDIDDRKQLERMRQEFFAMVSHDLRTPLTAINGVAQLMQVGTFGKLTAEATACLKELLKNVRALLELINDILDLEKLDAGKMELSCEAVKLAELIDAVRKHMADYACNLDVSLPASQIESVEIDKDRLAHAIGNLCKYMILRAQQDNSKLDLSVRRNNGTIHICIEDAGPLISAKNRKQLFQKIKEPGAHEKISDSTFHADLALPLAAKTVESHGGSIVVEESDGRCNVFHLTIPVDQTEN